MENKTINYQVTKVKLFTEKGEREYMHCDFHLTEVNGKGFIIVTDERKNNVFLASMDIVETAYLCHTFYEVK